MAETEPTASEPPIARRTGALLRAGFWAALLAPSVGLCFGLGGTSAERRNLAPAPEWPPSSWRECTAASSRWFADHFAFRSHLMQAHQRVVWWLGDSPLPDVVRGARGWLYWDGDRALDLHRRVLPPLSVASLRSFVRGLTERTAFLRTRGASFRFVIAPEKPTIHPDFVPVRFAPTAGVDRGEQLRAELARHPETGFVDLYGVLRSAAVTAPCYLRTDTHWSDHGAVVAYRALLASLATEQPELAPRSADTLLGEEREMPGGDLADLCGTGDLDREVTRVLDPRPPLQAVRLPARAGDRPPDAHWRRAAAPHAGAAVLFGDSFLARLQPLVADHFAVCDAYATHEFDVSAILATDAKVVICEIGERLALQWLPRNPVPVRRAPTPADLARLQEGHAPARLAAELELLGARLEPFDGDVELALAWRAHADATLAGAIRIALLDAAGREVYVGSVPQDPLGWRVAATMVWLDYVPLVPGVQRVRVALTRPDGSLAGASAEVGLRP